MDIKLKIQAANEAAEHAENLAKEAQQEAEDLLNDLNENAEEQEQDEKQPIGYRFIEIPEYAYTHDQDDTLTQIDENSEDIPDWLKKIKEGIHNIIHWNNQFVTI